MYKEFFIFHRGGGKTIKEHTHFYVDITHYTTMETINQDQLRFVHPFSMTLAGGRRTGKTHFTQTLLKQNRELVSPPPLDTIVWFYGAEQPALFIELDEKMKSLGQRIEFVNGLPKEKTIQELVSE